MNAQEYINLTDQIARQTPEQQDYLDQAAALNAQAAAMQPVIDNAQADVDAAQIEVNDAQAALDAAIAAGEDPVPFEEALAAARVVLAGAQVVLIDLTNEQGGLTSEARRAEQFAAGLGAMMASCQALIDANPPTPTAAQIAAERAREAVLMTMESKMAGAPPMAVVTSTFSGLPTKIKILAALGISPLRNTVFLLTTGAKTWVVFYTKLTDEYLYEELMKAA